MADPIITNTPQQTAEAIQKAQQAQPVEPIQAPANAWPVSIPETPAQPATVETTKPENAVLNLWGGKIVDKKSPKYQALIAKGMTDADIIKSFQEATQKQAKAQAPAVENKPVAQPQQLDYQSAQPERKTEIVDNLNKFYQTNPEMFSDRNAFNTFFDYNDKRSPEQRQLLDSWYNQNITKRANASNLDKTPTNDIATMYSSGTISNEDVDLLKNTNPQKYWEVVQAIEKQKTAQKYKEQMLSDEKKEVTPADKILAKIDELYDSVKTPSLYEDYKREINSDDVKALQNDLSAKEGEIKEIDNQINAAKSELEKQFKWQAISQGRLNALIQDQTQLLQNQRNTKAIEYQTLADKYNNKMNTIKTNLEIAEKEYSLSQQQQKNQVEKYQFAYSIFADQQKRDDMFKMEDIRFDRDIEKMKLNEEMQFNSAVKMDKLQNGDINSADPYIVQKAIEKWVDSLMRQYDWLIDSSRDQLVARVKEWVKSGKPYGEVLGGIMEDIKGKPLFNQWKMNKLWLDTDPKPFAPWLYTVKNPDGTTRVINEKQLQDRYNIPSAEKEAAQKAVIEERKANGGISQYDDKGRLDQLQSDPTLWVWVNCGKQCGWYTTDVLARIMPDAWIRFGSTPESKDNAIMAIGESPVPVVGGFVSLNTSAPEWHTGWVTEVSPDGQSIKVRNSNYRGTAEKPDNTVTENWFNISKVRKASIAPWNKAPSGAWWASWSALESALTNVAPWMTADARKSTVASMKNYVANGDIENAKTLLSNAISDNLKWQEKIKYDFLTSTVDNIDALKSAYSDFKAKGGDTGLFAGNLEDIAKKVGKVKDPALRWLATTILMSVQQYRKDISGAAFSPQEAAEYESIFPSISNSIELNDTILSSLDKTLRNSQSNFMSRKIWQQNYQSIFWNEPVEFNVTQTTTWAWMDSTSFFEAWFSF